MVNQLEDYIIPRIVTLEAPLLAVVGGSTGAGKSTLVNSLVGAVVTEAGVLRPTTRSPVLVHNPADADWFGADRLLPELERIHHPTHDPHALQLVPVDVVPQGLAILDAPDVDSVEESNRLLAAQLLAAADLWLFVTSAAQVRRPGAVGVPAPGRRALGGGRDRARPHPGGRRRDRGHPPGPDAGGARTQGLAAVHHQRGRAQRATACSHLDTSPRSAAGWRRSAATPRRGPRWSGRPSRGRCDR